MVFQKKGGVKGKQQTPAKPKKAVKQSEDLEDVDMDFDDSDSDDSDSDEKVKSTGKTPKGKQMDKRVSFQIPNKNTPNKTPKSDSFITKKPTPAKPSALKEFGGMLAAKNGKSNKKPADLDDDDDDDEDDEDDDEDADLDMLLGDSGDDDDEDDDDEDDDDEDDDDEEPSKKPQSSKQQNQSKSNLEKDMSVQKTPVKKLEKTPAKTPNQSSKGLEKQPEKGRTPQMALQPSAKTPLTPEMQKIVKFEAEQRRERNLKTLFIGNLPLDVALTEIKALSTDILEVTLGKPRKKQRTLFGFLLFANEAKAEENFKMLKNKKFRGETFKLDFVGEKRQNHPTQEQLSPDKKNLNLKKLYISSLPEDVTIYQIAKFFPKAHQICINPGYSQKHATVLFLDEKDAAVALKESKDAKLGTKPLSVLYSIGVDKKNKKRKRPNKTHPAKKAKLEVSKQESDDDDDDDDDDDED